MATPHWNLSDSVVVVVVVIYVVILRLNFLVSTHPQYLVYGFCIIIIFLKNRKKLSIGFSTLFKQVELLCFFETPGAAVVESRDEAAAVAAVAVVAAAPTCC